MMVNGTDAPRPSRNRAVSLSTFDLARLTASLRILLALHLAGPEAAVQLTQDELHGTDWSDPEELEAVPRRQEHDEVEPTWTAVADDGCQSGGDDEVEHTDAHGEHTPLEAPAGSDRPQEPVGRHPVGKEVTDNGADGLQWTDHGTHLSRQGFADEAVRYEWSEDRLPRESYESRNPPHHPSHAMVTRLALRLPA